MKAYLAAPIFTEKDQIYNEIVAQRIEKEFPQLELYVSQRNKAINDKTKCATAEQICQGDFDNNLNHTDIVIALVDNDTPGIGTTLEVGYFGRICQEEIDRLGYTNKRIISLYTDSRECSNTVNDAKIEKLHEFAECQFSYLNLLLVGALKRYGTMCRTIDEVIGALREAVSAYGES